MNDRIQQLAKQARAWVNDPDNVAPVSAYIFYKDMYDKKFAELIVAECLDNCMAANDRDRIREHFGVEL